MGVEAEEQPIARAHRLPRMRDVAFPARGLCDACVIIPTVKSHSDVEAWMGHFEIENA